MADEQPGLRPIGSQVSRIASSLNPKVLTQPTLPAASVTTGTPRLVETPPSSIGTRHGGTGAAASMPGALSSLLAGSDPAMTDATLLATCGQRLGQQLVSVREAFIDPDYGYDSRFIGYELSFPIPAERLKAAEELVNGGLQSSPPELIIQELARLRRLTKSRAEDETDREASYIALAEELIDFPPDVIRSVLRGIGRTSTFFPALAELYRECEQAVHHRRLIANAVFGLPPPRRSEAGDAWLAKIWGSGEDGRRARREWLGRQEEAYRRGYAWQRGAEAQEED
jgi:hypothetical protein